MEPPFHPSGNGFSSQLDPLCYMIKKLATIYNDVWPAVVADGPGCTTSVGEGGSIAKSNRLCLSWADSATSDVEGKLSARSVPNCVFPGRRGSVGHVARVFRDAVSDGAPLSQWFLPVWWIRVVVAKVKWRVYNSFCVLCSHSSTCERFVPSSVCREIPSQVVLLPSPSASLFCSNSNTKVCECF